MPRRTLNYVELGQTSNPRKVKSILSKPPWSPTTVVTEKVCKELISLGCSISWLGWAVLEDALHNQFFDASGRVRDEILSSMMRSKKQELFPIEQKLRTTLGLITCERREKMAISDKQMYQEFLDAGVSWFDICISQRKNHQIAMDIRQRKWDREAIIEADIKIRRREAKLELNAEMRPIFKKYEVSLKKANRILRSEEIKLFWVYYQQQEDRWKKEELDQ